MTMNFKQITGYLCGPIAGCDDSEVHGWREQAKALEIEGWIRWLDPTRRDCRDVDIDVAIACDIVEDDKIDITQSDVLLVNINPTKSSVGTHQEVLFAWELGKENILVVPEGAYLSPWLMYHSRKVFHRFPDAFDYLRDKYARPGQP